MGVNAICGGVCCVGRVGVGTQLPALGSLSPPQWGLMTCFPPYPLLEWGAPRALHGGAATWTWAVLCEGAPQAELWEPSGRLVSCPLQAPSCPRQGARPPCGRGCTIPSLCARPRAGNCRATRGHPPVSGGRALRWGLRPGSRCAQRPHGDPASVRPWIPVPGAAHPHTPLLLGSGRATALGGQAPHIRLCLVSQGGPQHWSGRLVS